MPIPEFNTVQNAVGGVQHWQLRAPLMPKWCTVTHTLLWLKPCYHGEFHHFAGIDDVWVDRNTLHTLILKGWIKL